MHAWYHVGSCHTRRASTHADRRLWPECSLSPYWWQYSLCPGHESERSSHGLLSGTFAHRARLLEHLTPYDPELTLALDNLTTRLAEVDSPLPMRLGCWKDASPVLCHSGSDIRLL